MRITEKAKTMAIFLLDVVLMIVILGMLLSSCGKNDDIYQIDENKLVSYQLELAPEPTPPPEPIEDLSDSNLYWLARCMEKEDGVDWTDCEIMMIGEVVMNRVESPFFPNTVKEVVLQPGQYEPFMGDYDIFEPGDRYIELAQRLLDGERVMNNPDVVWQALFIQGSSIFKMVYDPYLKTTTYFCVM